MVLPFQAAQGAVCICNDLLLDASDNRSETGDTKVWKKFEIDYLYFL